MKTVYIFGISLFVGFISIITSFTVLAETNPEFKNTQALALRKIMANMGENMQIITDGISHEDWKRVEKAASMVAEHPQPPFTERMKILSFMASNISEFKNNDTRTHNAAISLSQAAAEKDGIKVISEFATLQHTCLACHQSFRPPFKEHFYNK